MHRLLGNPDRFSKNDAGRSRPRGGGCTSMNSTFPGPNNANCCLTLVKHARAKADQAHIVPEAPVREDLEREEHGPHGAE